MLWRNYSLQAFLIIAFDLNLKKFLADDFERLASFNFGDAKVYDVNA